MRPMGEITYITRHENGTVRYISASETLLCLSNLMRNKAAVARFALEDARDGNDAAKLLRALMPYANAFGVQVL